MPLIEEKLLKNIKSTSLFGYVQCDIEVLENLRKAFANFPPIFKNVIVGTDDIGTIMKEYAEKEYLLTQPGRILISSFCLEIGTMITLLLLFCLDLRLVCRKSYRFVQYSSMKCFNNFVHSAVNARREGNENSNSSVVAETIKLVANSSYGYQILDRSRHTVMKYLSDEKTQGVIEKLFNPWVNRMINCMKWSLSSQKLNIEY